MTFIGYSRHEPDIPWEQCQCWSCSNRRKVIAAEKSQKEARTKALALAADLVVTHVEKDVYRIEHGDMRVEGKLQQILKEHSPSERVLIDVFEAIPLLERFELLQYARARRTIRVRDMKFSKDEIVEEKP